MGVTERTRIRPLDRKELILTALALYKRKFWLLSAVSATVVLPCGLLNALVPHGSRSTTAIIATFSVTVVQMAAFTALSGALAIAAAAVYLERYESVQTCYRKVFALSLYWPILGAQLLRDIIAFAMVGAGAVLGLIIGAARAPGNGGTSEMWQSSLMIGMLSVAVLASPIWIRLCTAEQVIVLEKKGACEGLRRSWDVFGGNVVRLAWLWMPLAFLSVAVGSAWGAYVARHDLPSVVRSSATILNSLFQAAVFWPLTSVLQTVIYLDLRARREDLYTQTLATHLTEGVPER